MLTAQEFTTFQELLMVLSRDSCYSSHRSEHSQYYVLWPPPPTENKTNKNKTKKQQQQKIILLLYAVLSENEPKSALSSSVLMHTSFLFCTITLVSSYQV